MTNQEWLKFFTVSQKILGTGCISPLRSDSWFAFTTFTSLKQSQTYWYQGFPEEALLQEQGFADTGLPIAELAYSEIAHIIVPASFSWSFKHRSGTKFQNIKLLSENLDLLDIEHRRTELLLEVKLY